MALINLTVKSDFDRAAADLKKFGDVTDAEKKRIERFANSFKAEQIDKFIDKNRRAAVALTATRGPIEANVMAQKNLQREIERLIRNGLDPMSKEVQSLKREYDRLGEESKKLANTTSRLVLNPLWSYLFSLIAH